MAYELTTEADRLSVQNALKFNFYGQRPVLGSAIGDSITAMNLNSTTYSASGFVCELRSQSMGRFNIPMSYIQGVGGESGEQIVARIPNIIALNPRPQFCIVYLGTNVGTNSRTAFVSAIKQLSEANILPVIMGIQPSTTPDVAARRAQVDSNNWLYRMSRGDIPLLTAAGLGPQHTFVFVNPARFIVDYGSATGACLSIASADGLHPSAYGHFWMGYELNRVLSQVFGLYDIPVCADFGGAWSSGTPGASGVGAAGSLIPATLGVMYGTGGTAGGTPAGSTQTNNGIATGMSYSRWTGNGTETVVLSKVAKWDAATGTRQQIAISNIVPNATPSPIYGRYRFAVPIPSGNLTVGDYICAELEAEVIGTPVGLLALNLAIGNYSDCSYSGSPMAQVAHRRLLRTPPMLVTSVSGNTAEFMVYMDNSLTSTGSQATVAFDKFVVYKCGALM